MYHSRTKHIDVRYHWLRQAVDEQQFKLDKIHTDENPTDMMTKVVTGGKLQLCAELIDIECILKGVLMYNNICDDVPNEMSCFVENNDMCHNLQSRTGRSEALALGHPGRICSRPRGSIRSLEARSAEVNVFFFKATRVDQKP
ncbi:Unknown protein [Striga hermonthica]|uniref:Uncharacterized protein n=1 Tax=Striga hermonthica TaxID=68872 RepID=A0A9N7MVN9_STRHE|nr:Unknown protein [Striga hermonthica]